MGKRKFASIQPYVQNGAVTLIAIADDGTAWSCRGETTDNWEPHSVDADWVQIPSLPDKDEAKLPPMSF